MKRTHDVLRLLVCIAVLVGCGEDVVDQSFEDQLTSTRTDLSLYYQRLCCCRAVRARVGVRRPVLPPPAGQMDMRPPDPLPP